MDRQRIRDAALSGTKTHTLIVGPRGSGKTHLIAVSIHRARADPEVEKRLAVAWIPEDALAVGQYADLLLELIRQLDPDVTGQAKALRKVRDHDGLEQLLPGPWSWPVRRCSSQASLPGKSPGTGRSRSNDSRT